MTVSGRSPGGSGSRPADRDQEVAAVPASIPSAWRKMDEAPRDGTPFYARTFDGFQLVAKWEDGFVDDEGEDCGGWVAAFEDVHPEDWTDGACWQSNVDDIPSDPLVGWQSIAEVAATIANRCRCKAGTDNYARVYQGAFSGACEALRWFASGPSSAIDATVQP